MSQVGEPWDCGGGWRDFVHTDPRSALMLLARAARRGSWPVVPWYAALGVRNDKGVWNEASTSLAARVLQRMPLEDMSCIALQQAKWLEGPFDILPKTASASCMYSMCQYLHNPLFDVQLKQKNKY